MNVAEDSHMKERVNNTDEETPSGTVSSATQAAKNEQTYAGNEPDTTDMVWPSSDVGDPSVSFLDSERSKYPPRQSSTVLFTWQGFIEKMQWVFNYFFTPCTSNAKIHEPRLSQKEGVDELDVATMEKTGPTTGNDPMKLKSDDQDQSVSDKSHSSTVETESIKKTASAKKSEFIGKEHKREQHDKEADLQSSEKRETTEVKIKDAASTTQVEKKRFVKDVEIVSRATEKKIDETGTETANLDASESSQLSKIEQIEKDTIALQHEMTEIWENVEKLEGEESRKDGSEKDIDQVSKKKDAIGGIGDGGKTENILENIVETRSGKPHVEVQGGDVHRKYATGMEKGVDRAGVAHKGGTKNAGDQYQNTVQSYKEHTQVEEDETIKYKMKTNQKKVTGIIGSQVEHKPEDLAERKSGEENIKKTGIVTKSKFEKKEKTEPKDLTERKSEKDTVKKTEIVTKSEHEKKERTEPEDLAKGKSEKVNVKKITIATKSEHEKKEKTEPEDLADRKSEKANIKKTTIAIESEHEKKEKTEPKDLTERKSEKETVKTTEIVIKSQQDKKEKAEPKDLTKRKSDRETVKKTDIVSKSEHEKKEKTEPKDLAERKSEKETVKKTEIVTKSQHEKEEKAEPKDLAERKSEKETAKETEIVTISEHDIKERTEPEDLAEHKSEKANIKKTTIATKSGDEKNEKTEPKDLAERKSEKETVKKTDIVSKSEHEKKEKAEPEDLAERKSGKENIKKIKIVTKIESEAKQTSESEDLMHEELSVVSDAAESTSTIEEMHMKEDEKKAHSNESPGSRKEEKIFKVDKSVKRIFKRKVSSYVKHVVRSRSLYSFPDKHDEEAVVTPTVYRLDKDSRNSTPKKEELAGSGTLFGRKASKDEDIVRLVAVIGYDGYGKTSFMKRYADMASGRLHTINELTDSGIKRCHPFARKDFFKFVHYIDFRDLPSDGEYTPSELLFNILVENLEHEEAEFGYRWLQIYNNTILFVVDGVNDLDLFPEKVRKHVSYYDKASPQCIMYNLLTGNILPNAYVLMSSNARDSHHLTDVLSPDRIYTLNGFDKNDIKTYLGKNTAIWKHLTEGDYNNLLASSKVPIGLFYAATALSNADYNIDSLLGAITQYIRYAVNEKEGWDPADTMDKIQVIAFECSMVDREVLTTEDLIATNLSVEDIENCQLFTKKNVGRIEKDGSIRWITTYTFCHVTIREFLSALRLCEDTMAEFRKFADGKFHEARYLFQQKCLYGIIFNDINIEGMTDLLTITHLEEKRNILRKSLVHWIESKPPTLYLYTILHECITGIDDVLKEKLRTLSLVGGKLTPVSVFVIASLACRIGSLDTLELRDCIPTEETLRRFVTSVQGKKVTIRTLILRENPGILSCGAAISDLCHNCSVEELDFGSCWFRGEILATLPRIVRDIELKCFKIGDNPEIAENSVNGIGEFVRKSNITKLAISNTAMNEAKLRRLRKSLKNAKLEKLDISDNKDVGMKGVTRVGKIAEECHLQDLNMARCSVTTEYFKSFRDGLKSAKLKTLDVSTDEIINVSSADIITICQLLPCVTEELKIENWCFSAENLKTFEQNVKELAHPNLKVIYGEKGETISK